MDWDLEGIKGRKEAKHREVHIYRLLHTACDCIYKVTSSLELLLLCFPATMDYNLELLLK